MNYRKVMLGCALAIGAPYGAQAADAMVAAEPEPIGYVRICDTYGVGFYYLPGTETCLRVGGYIRYEIGVGDLFGADRDDDGRGDTYFKRARAALKIDARSETELGTLRRYMHINFQHDIDADGGHEAMEIESAIIELGGLRIGVNDSLFITFVNYAGYVSKDDVIGYGPFATPQIAYTYKNENGFTAAVSLETGYDPFVVDSYMPHVVAGLSYAQSWGGVAVVAAYDSVSEEWSGKLRLDATFSDTISAFAMAGLKSDHSAPYSQFYGIWGGRWALWGGASIKASDKASVNFQLSYDEDENFAAVANVAYQVVPDLMVTPELRHPLSRDEFLASTRFSACRAAALVRTVPCRCLPQLGLTRMVAAHSYWTVSAGPSRQSYRADAGDHGSGRFLTSQFPDVLTGTSRPMAFKCPNCARLPTSVHCRLFR